MAADREERRYSDDEVRHLLGRASELETEVAKSPARIEGPTLPELEEIAREAGIDPALVRRAAEELDTPVAPEPAHLPKLGGVPLRIELERVVPGGGVPAEMLEAMLGTIQRATGDTGSPTVLRHSLSWRSSSSDGKKGTARPVLNVSVTSAQGETRITTIEEYSETAKGWFAGWIAVGLGGGFPVGLGVFGVFGAVGLPAAILGAGFLATRAALQRKVRERGAELTRLIDDLARLVSE